jgi:hypothetical protein
VRPSPLSHGAPDTLQQLPLWIFVSDKSHRVEDVSQPARERNAIPIDILTATPIRFLRSCRPPAGEC